MYVPPVSVTKFVSKRSCLFIGEVPWYCDLRPLSGTSNSMVVMRNGRDERRRSCSLGSGSFICSALWPRVGWS